MAWKVGHGWFVEAGTSVDVDCVDDLVVVLASFYANRMRGLVLACWCEEQAAIWSEGEASEEGCELFIGVNICVFDAEAGWSWRSRWHDGGKRH